MPSRSDLNIDKAIQSRFILGLGLLSLVVVLLLHWIPALAITFPILGVSAGGYWIWTQWKKEQCQQRRRQAKIDAMFYQLLRQQQGRISILDFAMHTQLHGVAAQNYLNMQAQALTAYYETTPHGDIVYVFNLAAVQQAANPHRATPAESTWAYAEQAKAEQAHREKAQAAWANAKQIRRLHQISKQASKRSPKSAAVAETGTPAGIQAGYIAITEIDNHGQDIKASNIRHPSPKQPKSHRTVELPQTITVTPEESSEQSTVIRGQIDHESDQVMTIDVQAVDVQAARS